MTRGVLRRPATGALLALALVAGAAAAQAGPRPRSEVALSVTPAAVEAVVGLPCLPPAEFTLSMTNTGAGDVYADSTLTSAAPFTLSRRVFSSWLPAADPDVPVSADVTVRVPPGVAPGTYPITIASGRTSIDVPVQVLAPPAQGPGDNIALGQQASASSTNSLFTPCGAVDGDADPLNWFSTGWNDGTASVFPDTFEVQLASPQPVDRVELTALDSTRYPGTRYAIRDWDVQLLVDGAWVTVDEVRGNVGREVTSTFSPVTASAVRIVVLAANDRFSRIVELEVFAAAE